MITFRVERVFTFTGLRTHVGATRGRGRYDTYMKRTEPRKDIWLRPLRRDWKRTLNR